MLSPADNGQPVLTDAQISRYANVRKQAQKFVAQTFFGPLMKQMRNSPFKSELLSGGRGGEVYQSMLDGVLVERMGGGLAGKLVDAIARRLDPETARHIRSLEAAKLRDSANSAAGTNIDFRG